MDSKILKVAVETGDSEKSVKAVNDRLTQMRTDLLDATEALKAFKAEHKSKEALKANANQLQQLEGNVRKLRSEYTRAQNAQLGIKANTTGLNLAFQAAADTIKNGLVTAYRSLNDQLDDLKKKQIAETGSINKNAAEYRALTAQIKGVNAEIKGLGKGQLSMQQLTGSMTKGFMAVGASLIGPITGIALFASALGSAAKVVADFDQGLAKVRALGGEYKTNIDQIANAAKGAGTELGKTGAESLKAVEELAKAGLTTADILSGGLKGALDLSAAGVIEVGQAAEIASIAMTQFGLSGADIPHVADLLVAGANAAQGGVGDLGEALKQAGLVADSFGFTLDETVASLTMMANSGLMGSDSGTSLKNFLLRIAKPSKEAADAIKQLDINLYDANHEILTGSALAEEFQSKMGHLSQEQRNYFGGLIAGTDAIRVLNIMVKEGGEGFDEYAKKVNQAGIANETAKAQVNNVADAMTILNATWGEMILSIENGSGPISSAIKKAFGYLSTVLGYVIELNSEGDALGRNIAEGTDGSAIRDEKSFEKWLEIVNKYMGATSKLSDADAKTNEFLRNQRDGLRAQLENEKATIESLGKLRDGLETTIKDIRTKHNKFAVNQTEFGVAMAQIEFIDNKIKELSQSQADYAKQLANTEEHLNSLVDVKGVNQDEVKLIQEQIKLLKDKKQLTGEDGTAIAALDKRIAKLGQVHNVELDQIDEKAAKEAAKDREREERERAAIAQRAANRVAELADEQQLAKDIAAARQLATETVASDPNVPADVRGNVGDIEADRAEKILRSRHSMEVEMQKSHDLEMAILHETDLVKQAEMQATHDALMVGLLNSHLARVKDVNATFDQKRSEALAKALDQRIAASDREFENHKKIVNATITDEKRKNQILLDLELQKHEQRLRLIEDAALADGFLTDEEIKKIKEVVDAIKAARGELTKTDNAENGSLLQQWFGDEEGNAEIASQVFGSAMQLADQIATGIMDINNQRRQIELDNELAHIAAVADANITSLDEQLERGELTELEYKERKKAIEAKAREEERKAKIKAWKEDQNAKVTSAIINGALAVTSALATVQPFLPAGLIAGGVAAVAAGAQVALIKNQPMPNFRHGGLLMGPRHEAGGVPIYNNGGQIAEAEGGEYMVNANSTKAFLPILEMINSIGNNNMIPRVAAFEAANVRSAIGKGTRTNQPIRAFVVGHDITRNQQTDAQYDRESEIGE